MSDIIKLSDLSTNVAIKLFVIKRMPVRTGGLQIIWKYLWETQPLGDRE
jgi:hypothetical protein